jgi:hypothetical protein
MRVALTIVGVVAVLFGLLFLAQGAGVFPYPASSFMINQTVWIYRGAGLALLGAIALLISRRR